jgi:acylphosphatase
VTAQRVHAVVRGRVQGVWFRDACRREAVQHGVSGWVRNRGDGAVELEAEGERDAVDALLRWCHVGPRHALVTGVEVTDLEPTGAAGFHIR